jgi:hypothetical protein
LSAFGQVLSDAGLTFGELLRRRSQLKLYDLVVGIEMVYVACERAACNELLKFFLSEGPVVSDDLHYENSFAWFFYGNVCHTVAPKNGMGKLPNNTDTTSVVNARNMNG